MRKHLKFHPVREFVNRFRLPASRSSWNAGYLAATLAMLAGVPAASFAADMAVPTKAAPAPAYQWSGCYVGLNLGGGASGTNFKTVVDPGTHLVGDDPAIVSGGGSGSHGGDGLLAGGQVGCNLQSGMLVYGLEGDVDYFHSNPWFSNTSLTLSDGVTPFTIKQSLTTNYLATIRPRIGVAADRNLAYLTAGAAFTRVSYLETYADGAAPPGVGSAAASKSLVGWVAGAGWEYAFADRWTFRAEYLYAGFSRVNALGAITDAAGGANALRGSGDLTVQLLRAGVNYRF